MLNKIEVNTLVVKISSRCNLNCDYCYIYNGKDDSWKSMPKTMQENTFEKLIDRIEELYFVQETKPFIVLHGGEPLLVNIKLIKKFVDDLLTRVPTAKISIQSNGTIFSQEIKNFLIEYRERFLYSISVDGFQVQNDKHRKDHRGKGSFSSIKETIDECRDDKLIVNALSVVDTSFPPQDLVDFIEYTGIDDFNIILRDADYLTPPEKNGVTTGKWLCDLFDIYSQKDNKYKIRLLDDIATQILLLKRGIEKPPITYITCTITIDTDGQIKQSDTFRINGRETDKLGENITIFNHSIYEVANSNVNKQYMQIINTLPSKCLECKYVSACAGGYPSHRYGQDGYNNPSIYCEDYIELFEHIENLLP